MRTPTMMILSGSAALAVLATGCAEPRTVYVPTYQPASVYQTQPGYVYQQTNYQGQPLVTQTAPGSSIAVPSPAPPPDAVSQPPPQAAAPAQVTIAQQPPPPQVEYPPPPPGPDYAWTPGYWMWNGGWVWVGGVYVVRPHPYAIWIGPRWVRHGHGYVWVRGHWR